MSLNERRKTVELNELCSWNGHVFSDYNGIKKIASDQ